MMQYRCFQKQKCGGFPAGNLLARCSVWGLLAIAVADPIGAQTMQTASGVASQASSGQAYPQAAAAQPTGQTVLNRKQTTPWLQRILQPRSKSDNNLAPIQSAKATSSNPQPAALPASTAVQPRRIADTGNARENIQQPVPATRGSTSRTVQMPVPIGGTASRTPLTNSAAAERYRASYPQPQSLRSGESRMRYAPPSATRSPTVARSEIGSLANQSPIAQGMLSGGPQSQGGSPQPPNVARVPLPPTSKAFLKHAAEAGQESTPLMAGKQSQVSAGAVPSNVGVPPSVPRRERQPTSEVVDSRNTSPAQSEAQSSTHQGRGLPPSTESTASREPAANLQTSPGTVSLPTRLINTPLAEQAAKAEAHTRPTAPSFRTAQIQPLPVLPATKRQLLVKRATPTSSRKINRIRPR